VGGTEVNTPKRHHYLPQSYLRLFAKDDVIWVYDRDTNDIRAQKVIDTAVINHFNAVERKDGSRDVRIESELSKVEGLIPKLVDDLKARQRLNDASRFDLAFIAALMMTRTPEFHEGVQRVEGKLIKRFAQHMFRSEEDAARSLAEWKAEDPTAPDIDPKALFRIYSDGAFNIKIHRNRSIELMLKLSPEFAKTLFGLNIGVLHAPKNSSFITTDRPLAVVPPRDTTGLPKWGGIGLLTPGAHKYLTLSSHVAVVFGDSGDNFVHLDLQTGTARWVNAAVGRMTNRFLFGRDKLLVAAWSRRLRLSEIPKISGMDVA
jgi:Protein of unknown function (DUF4238)